MFKYLYNYYLTMIDTPLNIFKINLWSFINISFNKIKLSNNIMMLVNSFISMQQNFMKIFHKNFTFVNFFLYLILLKMFYIMMFYFL